MKKNYLSKSLAIFIFAGALCLSSCINEKETCNPVSDGCGYFSLALNPLNPSFTRAGGNVQGDDAENFVEKIAVILYDKETEIADYQFVYEISNIGENVLKAFAGNGIATTQNAQPSGEEAKIRVVTRAEVVAEKEYRVIVIANPTADMLEATAAGSEYENIALISHKTTVEELIGTSANRFVMSNSDGPVVLTAEDLTESASGAELNPLGVCLDRAVAKVAAVKDAGFDAKIKGNMGIDGGTKIYESISDISWSVDIVNNHTYWIRGTATAKNGTAEQSSNRENYYAKDPNMTQETSSVADAFTKKTLAAIPGQTLNALKLRADNDRYEYVTENTMDANVDAMLYGTQVIVKCKIQPMGMTASQNYYSYMGTVFTHRQAMGWVNDDLPIPESLLDVISENYGQTVTADNFQDVLSVTGFFDVDAEEGDAYAECNGVTYHYGQWNIYRIPIRHFSDLAPGAWGYYGVVRNNLYVVNITDITGPGCGSNEKYISSKTTVNPWIERDWDQGL